MSKQTVVSVNPVIGGASNSLDLTELKTLLDSGWVMKDHAESAVGPILVLLEQPDNQDGPV